MTPTPEKAAPIPADEVERYIVKCHEMSEGGRYSWWSRLAEILADRASQEERIREEGDEFNRGYLIAVANVMNMHKDAVIAAELLMQLAVTIDEAEALELTDYDMDALKRLRSEPRAAAFFKRKRRARLRGAAS